MFNESEPIPVHVSKDFLEEALAMGKELGYDESHSVLFAELDTFPRDEDELLDVLEQDSTQGLRILKAMLAVGAEGFDKMIAVSEEMLERGYPVHWIFAVYNLLEQIMPGTMMKIVPVFFDKNYKRLAIEMVHEGFAVTTTLQCVKLVAWLNAGYQPQCKDESCCFQCNIEYKLFTVLLMFLLHGNEGE